MHALRERIKLGASTHLTVKWSIVIRAFQMNVFAQYIYWPAYLHALKLLRN